MVVAYTRTIEKRQLRYHLKVKDTSDLIASERTS
jgi:hypothetical protein